MSAEQPDRPKNDDKPAEGAGKGLSDQCFDLMRAAAVGGAGAATGAKKVGEAIARGAVAGAVAAAAVDPETAGRAAGAVVGGVPGAIIGGEIGKENAKEIKAVAKEIAATPRDVIDHMKKRPVTAAAESIICPPLVIIDAKLRKLFGN